MALKALSKELHPSRYKIRAAEVQDGSGDGELKPDTKYRLNENGDFVEVA